MKTVLRIVIAVLMGMLVLAISSTVAMILLEQVGESYNWIIGPITHTAMLLLSLLIIVLLSKGKLSAYGIKTVSFKQVKSPVFVSLIAAPVAIAVASGIAYLLGFHLPSDETHPAGAMTFTQQIVFVWIYASICEEFLSRGLIQGYLTPLIVYRVKFFKFHISIPILVAALFFGLQHLALLTVGVDTFSVFVIVFAGTILGLIAGYYREITGSILPAIVVHILFNIWGSFADLFIS
ncbi:MAG: CPBP family intramembrane metalloprotease [candidate division Zixibacteria bacterium]|nr:CPBP family intramembrane metalloprotease [candidate division Zixibacteria bacterium]